MTKEPPGMTVMTYSQAVDPAVWALLRDNAGFLDHLRSLAGKQLAETLLAGAAVYQRVDPKDDDRSQQVVFRWTVAFQNDKGEIRARLEQMEEARLQGRREAAAILISAAERYEILTGGCAGVIALELRKRAKQIETDPQGSPLVR